MAVGTNAKGTCVWRRIQLFLLLSFLIMSGGIPCVREGVCAYVCVCVCDQECACVYTWRDSWQLSSLCICSNCHIVKSKSTPFAVPLLLSSLSPLTSPPQPPTHVQIQRNPALLHAHMAEFPPEQPTRRPLLVVSCLVWCLVGPRHMKGDSVFMCACV